jgi:hypothetical protein
MFFGQLREAGTASRRRRSVHPQERQTEGEGHRETQREGQRETEREREGQRERGTRETGPIANCN